MVYAPYKNLSCCKKTKKYLATQNVLLKMTNFTIISNLLVVTLFLVLMNIAMASKTPDYSILVWSAVLDVCLNFINIWLHFRSSDSVHQKMHEFIPEFFRLLSLIFFFIYKDYGSNKVFVYLILVYCVSVLYRLGTCTKYSKVKYLGVCAELMSRRYPKLSYSSQLTCS